MYNRRHKGKTKEEVDKHMELMRARALETKKRNKEILEGFKILRNNWENFKKLPKEQILTVIDNIFS